jgi:hypothetical protein
MNTICIVETKDTYTRQNIPHHLLRNRIPPKFMSSLRRIWVPISRLVPPRLLQVFFTTYNKKNNLFTAPNDQIMIT